MHAQNIRRSVLAAITAITVLAGSAGIASSSVTPEKKHSPTAQVIPPYRSGSQSA